VVTGHATESADRTYARVLRALLHSPCRDKDELIAVLSSRLETAMMEQGSAANDFEMPRQGHGFIPWGAGEDSQVSEIDARRRCKNRLHTHGRLTRTCCVETCAC
jgi:hypothetical protein